MIEIDVKSGAVRATNTSDLPDLVRRTLDSDATIKRLEADLRKATELASAHEQARLSAEKRATTVEEWAKRPTWVMVDGVSVTDHGVRALKAQVDALEVEIGGRTMMWVDNVGVTATEVRELRAKLAAATKRVDEVALERNAARKRLREREDELSSKEEGLRFVEAQRDMGRQIVRDILAMGLHGGDRVVKARNWADNPRSALENTAAKSAGEVAIDREGRPIAFGDEYLVRESAVFPGDAHAMWAPITGIATDGANAFLLSPGHGRVRADHAKTRARTK